MNQDEMDIALSERRKKPRKGGNEAVDAADEQVDAIVEEVRDAVAPAAPEEAAQAVEEPEAAKPEQFDVANEFRLQGYDLVRQKAQRVDAKVADAKLNDFMEVRRGNKWGRIVNIEEAVDERGRPALRITVEYPDGKQYTYKPYQKDMTLDGLYRVPGIDEPDNIAPEAQQKVQERVAPQVPQVLSGGDRAVPVPRMEVEPIEEVAEEQKQEIERLAKDREVLFKQLEKEVRALGPQNREPDFTKQRFIKAMQALRKAMKNNDKLLIAYERENALRRAERLKGRGAQDLDGVIDLLNKLEPYGDRNGARGAGRLPAPRRAEFNGPPLEEFDPLAVRDQRIAEGVNKVELDDFWKNKILNNNNLDDLAARGIDVRKYKAQIRDFLEANEPRPLAELDEAARFALEALVNRELVNPNKSQEEKNAMRNIVELAEALHNERNVFEPDDGTRLDARGALLLELSLSDVENALNNNGVLVDKNGNNLGFIVRKSSSEGRAGGGRAGSNRTFFVFDQTTGKIYIYKKDTSAENVKAELLALEVARGLGMRGVYPAEAHPKIDNVIVMGFAGQNMRLEKQKVAGEVVGGGDAVVDRAPAIQGLKMMILDAIMHNNDRHLGNWNIGYQNQRGLDLANQEMFPLMLDNGLAAAIVKSEPENLNGVKFLRNGVRNGDFHRAMIDRLGQKAFYEGVQLSIQQAIQVLRQQYPVGSNPDMDKLIQRAEEIRDADIGDWR
jgi:hypothetical protein